MSGSPARTLFKPKTKWKQSDGCGNQTSFETKRTTVFKNTYLGKPLSLFIEKVQNLNKVPILQEQSTNFTEKNVKFSGQKNSSVKYNRFYHIFNCKIPFILWTKVISSQLLIFHCENIKKFFLHCQNTDQLCHHIVYYIQQISHWISKHWIELEGNISVQITFIDCWWIGVYFLFVCLAFFVPLKNFSLIWTRHHYRWRAANFDLYSALMAIEQWGFFSVPHLLWHGASIYNGHLRGPVTLTPVAERLAVELSLTVFTT